MERPMSAKRIALCIASRGNPRSLFETLAATLAKCALSTTTAVIGLDDDDPDLANARLVIDALSTERIVVSVARRADTVGAVYNRCAAAIEADLYINGADDLKIVTPGWDAVLSQMAGVFPDNIGMIGFGQMPFESVLPATAATTRGLIERMGYFVQDYTPYWWMDTWLYEIATMIGRSHYVPLDVAFLGPLRTRGLRDFTYWACFFDEMRIHRRAIAEAILSSSDFSVSAERRQELRIELDHVCAVFERSQSAHRDSAHAAKVEIIGYDAPADERYRRVMARAEIILQDLRKSYARVA
jgi:hypothetical protein